MCHGSCRVKCWEQRTEGLLFEGTCLAYPAVNNTSPNAKDQEFGWRGGQTAAGSESCERWLRSWNSFGGVEPPQILPWRQRMLMRYEPQTNIAHSYLHSIHLFFCLCPFSATRLPSISPSTGLLEIRLRSWPLCCLTAICWRSVYSASAVCRTVIESNRLWI